MTAVVVSFLFFLCLLISNRFFTTTECDGILRTASQSLLRLSAPLHRVHVKERERECVCVCGWCDKECERIVYGFIYASSDSNANPFYMACLKFRIYMFWEFGKRNIIYVLISRMV